MSAIPHRRSLQATSALVNFDPIVLAFIDDLVAREEPSEGFTLRCRACARHFLIWRERRDIPLEAVDITVIEGFRQHDCDCCAVVVPAPAGLRPWRKRRSAPSSCTSSASLSGREESRHSAISTITSVSLRSSLSGCAARLCPHQHRTPSLRMCHPHCLAPSFTAQPSRTDPGCPRTLPDRQVMCFIPELFGGDRTYCAGAPTKRRSTNSSTISPQSAGLSLWSRPGEGLARASPEVLRVARPASRIATSSIDKHIGTTAAVLPAFGDDPRSYDAALVRKVLWEH